ncbi:H-NS family nucleoid-associated regulatory protein [Gilliamella sp. BG6]|uniref:H-NS histone family protein n=1 Tax=unclassified Gilliamella TaxID=2685620 RepID=UPI0039883377
MELNEVHKFLSNKKNITRLFKKYGSSYCEKLIARFNDVNEKIKETEKLRLIEEEEKQDKLKKVSDYMLSIGLKPNDLEVLKIRKEPTIKYQYIDENNKLTWSGRGKMPRWLSKQLEQGKSLDDFLVN